MFCDSIDNTLSVNRHNLIVLGKMVYQPCKLDGTCATFLSAIFFVIVLIRGSFLPTTSTHIAPMSNNKETRRYCIPTRAILSHIRDGEYRVICCLEFAVLNGHIVTCECYFLIWLFYHFVPEVHVLIRGICRNCFSFILQFLLIVLTALLHTRIFRFSENIDTKVFFISSSCYMYIKSIT